MADVTDDIDSQSSRSKLPILLLVFVQCTATAGGVWAWSGRVIGWARLIST